MFGSFNRITERRVCPSCFYVFFKRMSCWGSQPHWLVAEDVDRGRRQINQQRLKHVCWTEKLLICVFYSSTKEIPYHTYIFSEYLQNKELLWWECSLFSAAQTLRQSPLCHLHFNRTKNLTDCLSCNGDSWCCNKNLPHPHACCVVRWPENIVQIATNMIHSQDTAAGTIQNNPVYNHFFKC